ncbi:hypothetical protein BAE44_0021401 [Dichanthelium oligosanthes]|uniref:CASP-like protein n=1 Tax=Dichanthelium oligosanthes TaxID=888268 RepID=A0A1E5UXJ5_9POAL|nr:hypothetical protein BAE44_0021401 [Dichanthelium oligosanthes]
MALSYRLAAPALLILAIVMVSSSAEHRCSRQEQDPACHTAPVPPADGHRDHRQEAPVPPSRPLGLRTPVAAPPPPRSGPPRARMRPFHPSPPPPLPPPPPPCKLFQLLEIVVRHETAQPVATMIALFTADVLGPVAVLGRRPVKAPPWPKLAQLRFDHKTFKASVRQYITDDMALSSRLLAGVFLVLAVALVCSSAERSSAGPPRFGLQDHRQESPVPALRPLGLRKPVAAPPPPRSETPRGSIRPYQPLPPPPPPPPCS